MDLIWQVLHPQMPLFDYSLFFFLGGVSSGWSLASMMEPFFCDTVHLSSFCSQLALKASAAKPPSWAHVNLAINLRKKREINWGVIFVGAKRLSNLNHLLNLFTHARRKPLLKSVGKALTNGVTAKIFETPRHETHWHGFFLEQGEEWYVPKSFPIHTLEVQPWLDLHWLSQPRCSMPLMSLGWRFKVSIRWSFHFGSRNFRYFITTTHAIHHQHFSIPQNTEPYQNKIRGN